MSLQRNERAQGRPGARCTRGLMCKMHKANAHEHTGSAETLRPSPRNGFTAYFVLSSVTGLSCHRRPQEALASWKLDTSVGVSGPHDFAVRNSRARLAHRRVHRIPHPTFVTIAKRPSLRGTGWRELVALICPTAKAKYFSREGWTVICPSGAGKRVVPHSPTSFRGARSASPESITTIMSTDSGRSLRGFGNGASG